MTGSVEIQILFCAIALGLIQIVLCVGTTLVVRGVPWGVGPRDEPGKASGRIGGRIERAYKNFLETFPMFAVAVLVDHALGKSTPLTVLGAQLYIWARLIYVPAYVVAVPFTRTLVWSASLVGILLVMSAVWPG
jgi:uncharacterized MAPEG superfamily protein